jgi:hypothetical protein
MNRYPTLAISMSRILSQRLAQVTSQPAMAPVGAAPAGAPMSAPPSYLPAEPAQVNAAARRRAAAASGEVPAPRRGGFGAWYSGLSGFGKLRFVLLIMLLILLLCVTVPFTVYAIINGPAAAIRATTAMLERTASAIVAPGGYEVAAADLKLVERLRAADAQVPPTPTYTPFPTDTPQPTNTPLPTDTPHAGADQHAAAGGAGIRFAAFRHGCGPGRTGGYTDARAAGRPGGCRTQPGRSPQPTGHQYRGCAGAAGSAVLAAGRSALRR